jgi:transposase
VTGRHALTDAILMGRKLVPREQTEVINLEEFVPQDHLLRAIDRYLDLTEFREHLKPFYSHLGHSSVDPELIIRMLIIGYCYGIRSECRLCEEVHLNLAYRWFCHLGIHDRVPYHSTFSKNRHGRFRDSDAFRELFESVLCRCIVEGLVGGEGFATDASMIRANVRRLRTVRRATPIDWVHTNDVTRPVREYLVALNAANPPPEPQNKADTIIYRASEKDCKQCHLKEQCCPKRLCSGGLIRPLRPHNGARDRHRGPHIQQTIDLSNLGFEAIPHCHETISTELDSYRKPLQMCVGKWRVRRSFRPYC